ncbi:UDP-N-acetylglucosamine--N-acetylmuramyl-(pentapeptide) pyrophosphoryl-undecaprenol N-acetylglucosamine transferase [Richelia intracellularis HM01]|uniref:undecaprenyldiphospho-muramoylpentapeptide beta-N-acetylglucosaminyltransferase n=1 Tax=Richelia intracellularis TaxID=1164990 RepID=UPI0002B5FBF5|nr:undecaprenyldiphospho-muramoylpentapeptide beta-N-acetylglucosaminyltransferase [Richelia intracellularis]CCH65402.1 UDP-N-acetylglucosamine--N-acetylmuramyl-(pentapeptide) pyrophosphoryl-undecaprenol N-acetylglucosamine transferase [Richelia intracellularis HM01]
MANTPIKLLIAASGTGGHLFPAMALAQELPKYDIEWLGVSNRLETQLIPQHYKLNTIVVKGFQEKFGFDTFHVLGELIISVLQVYKLLQQGKFHGVFTTGGYIAAPALVAAKILGIPVILHESNALPGKVTRFLGPWCHTVALGFQVAAQYLPKAKTIYTSTPVRSQFLDKNSIDDLDLNIPENVPLIVVFGGSQGAVGINKLVRQCVHAWFAVGAYVVHLTGNNDPEASSIHHSQYICMPFYENMAALLQRASLAVSRAGAGSLTELAICGTPAILIPYPFAAEDHQTYNAHVFTEMCAGLYYKQSELTSEVLQNKVLSLINSPKQLKQMGKKAQEIVLVDGIQKLAKLVKEVVER